MRIEIVTEFETSFTENYSTRITARIVTDKGVVLCEGEDEDSWPDPKERRASAKAATKVALDRLEQMLSNARDVAKKSGL
jgi:hypothetical protein